MGAATSQHTTERLLAKLDGVRSTGPGRWSARCPAHPDREPSLTVTESSDRVLVHCFAGCTLGDVLAKIDTTPATLFFEQRNGTQNRKIAATYPYLDEQGRLLFEVVRYDPKGFAQRRPDDDGHWVWKLDDTRRVLYRLPEVVAADPTQTVFIVEGEKDVDALVVAGHVATCSPQGAGKWSKVADHARDVLAGRDVCVIADRDEPGRAHARTVASSLLDVAEHVTVAEAAVGKDAADHLGAGRTVADLVPLASTDPEVTSTTVEQWLRDADTTVDPPPPTGDEDPTGHHLAESFRPVDLAEVISGTIEQPVPTLLIRRGDGIESALIYPGAVNGLHGDSGIGKSWAAVLLLAERLAHGETVILVDLEDTPTSIVSRLRLLGVTDAQLVELLIYIRPTEPFGPFEVGYLVAMIRDRDITAVVIDSLGEAFGTEGINEDRDNEVGPWLRGVARTLAETGAAVVLIDHSTKSSDNPLHPSGSKRKRAAIGGASYLVEVVTGFAKGESGRLRITCAKDRHGTYRRGEHVAWLDMTTHPDSTVTLELIAPADAVDINEIATIKLVKVLNAATEPVNLRRLRALVRTDNFKIGQEALDDVIERAVHSGVILETKGPNRSRMFSTSATATP